MRKKINCLVFSLLLILLASPVTAQVLPSAATLLDKSIAYHDPDGAWYAGEHQIELVSKRPEGDDRKTTVQLIHARGMFGLKMSRDNKEIAAMLKPAGDCETSINGEDEISDEDLKKYRLTCEGITSQRDYHGYMLGLPMNLKDPGTLLDPVAKHEGFEGEEVITLKVTYSEDVGSDTWYFYLNPETYALIGCRFFHDESKNDGEYLIFEGESSFGSIKLPRVRKWYFNNNKKFLGEDEIVSRSFVGR